MNKIGMLSALAVATAAGTAMAQPVLNIRTILDDGTTSRNLAGAGPHTVRIYVQGRVDNWQQSVIETGSAVGTGAAGRNAIGWSILGLTIRSTEAAIGGVNGGARKLDKGVLHLDAWDPTQNVTGLPPSTLTSNPTWQADNTQTGNTHFGWGFLMREGVTNQGEHSSGNGVRAVVGGNLALVGSTTDVNVAVSDLNLTANTQRQGTNIGLNGLGATLAQGVWKTLYVMEYMTTDNSVRSFNVTVQVPSDQTGNRLAGLYSGTPNGGQINNEVFNALLGDNTVTISIVPAPGAAALLGIGGLVATRRRRS